ncbi:DNA primase [Megamonas hypermegale]|uniref:DNA primase n=1 Tax=Megamonas hypermegale TaxID=158847 RepID=UPI001956A2F0|nr:DNA primase [Megamonas hypermegale]MBM6760111.1 DNA primase [Megamonas hypermegale]MBM6832475.1 DNA primase [Megamonas hypermegale]HJG07838.1 DNA primase [Megamonas hypermegale]
MSTTSVHDDFVERVRSSSDILAVISSYVHLKKKGNRYWGCCPFHNEKTPSFSVVPQQGFFYCFGCHAGGNVFKFLSLIENVSYYEAIKLQAQRLNIPIPTYRKNAHELAEEQERNDLLKIHELAGSFFHNCLTKTALGAPGREYFATRQINSNIIEQFKLGYAPNLWDKLYTSFIKRGIPKELLAKSGLVTIKDSGKAYDRFRNRVIIPIADEHGHITGFGGRVITNADSPKYLNSPETIIFNKRYLLFGLDQAQKAIKEQNFAIVVEGYMDAISLHSYGITNAVASLGTAFTVQQCRKILRFSPNIYFCYDSDNAGQNATMRALAIASSSGANVRVISIPDGKDPDEFVKKHGAKAFYTLIDKALPLMEFQLQYVLKNTNGNTLEGKLSAINQLMPLLANISNAVERNEYIIRISNVLGIDEGVIRSDLQRQSSFKNYTEVNSLPGSNTRKIIPDKKDALTLAGRYLIKKSWYEQGVLDYVLSVIPATEFPNKLHSEILSYMSKNNQDNLAFTDIDAAEKLSEEAYSELSHCLVEEISTTDDVQFTEDCLKRLRRYYLNNNYEKHRLLADQLQRNGDSRFLDELKITQQLRTQMDNL